LQHIYIQKTLSANNAISRFNRNKSVGTVELLCQPISQGDLWELSLECNFLKPKELVGKDSFFLDFK